MKRSLLFSALMVFVTALIEAQAPQQLNYQAIVRDAGGHPLPANTQVGLRFQIHQGTASGTVVYSETSTAITNQFGLITYQIGSAGNLSSVSWSSGAEYLQVELDPAGGTNYTDMGVSQLLSVPYALFSGNATSGPQGATGAQGPQGNNGVTGVTGPTGVGIQGATGAAGIAGLAGVTGASGVQGIQGATGPQGSTGAQGIQGPSGTQGVAGPTGAQGATGDVGATGQQGVQGLQGPSGPQGVQGAVGPSGPQGTAGNAGAPGAQGATGNQGAQGLQGVTGPTGAQGNNGVAGATGAQGDQGPTGAQGVQGAQGLAGATGAQGSAGANGATGAQGSQGIQGATGLQGVQGLTGSTGPQGTDGSNGATGAQGAQGAQGATGATGLQGDAGATGVTGAQGLQGPTGSQGLQGAQGAAGATGTPGIQGPSGNDGPTGAQGSQGAQGLQGPSGATGPSGAAGSAGATGSQGAQGTQGNVGATGAAGSAGPTGAQGSQGLQGPTGFQGSQGVQGSTGVTGATGTNGSAGTNGLTGATGAAGPTGSTGANGTAGAAGAAGATGPTGTAGATGFLQAGVTGAIPYYNGTNWVTTATNVYDDGGFLGVGSTAPVDMVDIYSGSTWGNVHFASSTTGAAHDNGFIVGLNTPAGDALVWNWQNEPIYLGTSGTDRMIITGGGNVGIGTQSPGQILTVVDAGNANTYSGTLSVYANNLTQGVGIGYQGIAALGSNANQDLALNSLGTGNVTMQLNNGSGNVGVGMEPGNNRLLVYQPGGGAGSDNATGSVNAIYGEGGNNTGSYTFGVSGYDLGESDRSGGVNGAWDASIWAALGYENSAANLYGLYYTSAGSGGGFLPQGNKVAGIGAGGYGNFIGSWTRGGVIGHIAAGELAAGYNIGNVYTSGQQIEIVNTGNARVAAYSNTSTQSTVSNSGTAQLTNGNASVQFDKQFASLLAKDEEPVVTVTPVGNCNGIHLVNVTAQGFDVEENNGGSSSVKFNFIVMGKRIDAGTTVMPVDFASKDFDQNLKGFMFNEADNEHTAKPMWWDGNGLRFEPIPAGLNPKKTIPQKTAQTK